MAAYYNENDPFAAAWLRELIKENLIAPGEVDERSIEEVRPEDLRGFTQCHFFAGVSGWSLALRGAGVSDDEPLWTGSCPCPPFSSAGTKKACPQCGGTNPLPHVGRTGFFVCCLCDHEWFADARHLWPELWRLIRDCCPHTFFGEQVAPEDGRTWLASVRASLEILGYAIGAADLCSAGVGASDIRQRLYFVAHASDSERGWRAKSKQNQQRRILHVADGRAVSNVGESDSTRSQPRDEAIAPVGYGCSAITASRIGVMGQSESNGRIGRQNNGDTGRRECSPRQAGTVSELGDSEIDRERTRNGQSRQSERQEVSTRGSSVSGELAQPNGIEPSNGELQRGRRLLQPSENPLTGFWSNAEWIYCSDEKWRPVEPGTFPLAHGVPARVGRLRAYGNAINVEVAKAFIESYIELISQ